MTDALEVTVMISMADIEDDALIAEYWRRFPWNWEEEVDTFLNSDPRAVDPELLAKLRAWIDEALK